MRDKGAEEGRRETKDPGRAENVFTFSALPGLKFSAGRIFASSDFYFLSMAKNL